jgi:pro-sigmaK processing inhibitor BofA
MAAGGKRIMDKILPAAVLIIVVAVMIKLFTSPVKWFIKLLVNTALGLVLLFCFNYFGSAIGVTVGLNLVNGLIMGIFGPAGLVLLLLLRWLTG